MKEKRSNMTKAVLKGIAVYTAAALFIGTSIIGGTSYAQTASAISITLEKTDGSQILINTAAGRKLSARGGMRLYNGYRVSTGVKSYAYMALDNKKAVKTNELSRVEIKKEGRKNEIKVICGKVFFNVKEKLTEKESMKISTSNISMGIRGTSGMISMDPVVDEQGNITGFTQTVQIYDGSVELAVSGTGKEETVLVGAGEAATLTGSGADGGAIDKKPLTSDEIPSFAGGEMLSDQELLTRVKEGSDITPTELREGMESSRQAEDEERKKLENIVPDDGEKGPEYFEEQPTNPPDSSDSGSGGENSGGGGTVTIPTPTPVPTPVPTPDVFTLQLDTVSDGELLDKIENALGNNHNISIESTNERTVTIDRAITIGSGRTVSLGRGVKLKIVSGGSLENAGSLANAGEIEVEAGGILKNSEEFDNEVGGQIEEEGILENSGNFKNKGSFIMDDGSPEMTNSGTIINYGVMCLKKGSVINDGGRILAQRGTYECTIIIDNRNGGSVIIRQGTEAGMSE